MVRHQAQALRTVLGAYKATPIRSLELDAFCPPLDIYLNKRVADFELRMQLSGLSLQLDRATAYVEARLRDRRPRRDRRKPLEGTHQEWAKNWTGSTGNPDVAGIPKRPRPETGRPVGQPKPTQRRRELILPRRPRRSREATFVCTRSWQKPRARRYVKRARKRPGFKDSCSTVRCLGLFPLLVHADEGIKP